ncbi:hypothetical protein P154DRAFT_537813 [Amniculicola lignicola CBS 123094]|uniref:SGNH hydrolase n=1 Tax=Amniculicola lignicola CBS 123094 TaxID=1392246 RepID=A0A6A5WG22_9PLEO|nr:hypothetical protein P154DRAFT_537813 [Amniculicola lignicola CBS 123094]
MWLPACTFVIWLFFAALATSRPEPLQKSFDPKSAIRRQQSSVEDPESYIIDEAIGPNQVDNFTTFDYHPAANFPTRTINKWIALGDSFAAGPGAGMPFDDNSMCMRGLDAYPIKLQQESNMKGPQGPGFQKPEFEFAACTGAITDDLLATYLQGNQLRNLTSDTTMATLSITGKLTIIRSDVRFSATLQACVYGIIWAGNCQRRLDEGQELMYNGKLWGQYNALISEIVHRFNPTWPVDHTLVYRQGYLQFFDETTDECDKASFRTGGPSITKELRTTLNLLTHKLNYVVQYWIDLRNAN